MGGDLVSFLLMGGLPPAGGSKDMSDRNISPKVRYIHYIVLALYILGYVYFILLFEQQ